MIDYKLIGKAVEYYEGRGFENIEVPWMVTEYVDSITRPSNVKGLKVPLKEKNLIASGEQGFLYLMLKDFLPKGRYQTTTPCFRQDVYDFTHSKVFMKTELIDTKNVNENSLEEIITSCLEFFETLFGKGKVFREQQEDGTIDLTFEGIELGSYGIRKHNHMRWVFGTGLAEPRTGRLLKSF